MKIFDRVVSLILSLVFFLPASVFAISVDEAGLNVEREAVILEKLGILTGYDDRTFSGGTVMTRAEYCAIVTRLLGISETSGKLYEEHRFFNDVDDWRGGYINTLAAMGIVSGTENGTFSPDDALTYGAALKIMLGAMGCGRVAEERGGYPSGYMYLAASFKLTSGISAAADEYLLRRDVVKLIYNALDAPIYRFEGIKGGTPVYSRESGSTFLSEYLDIGIVEGVVNATSKTALTQPTENCAEGKIRIGTKEYSSGDENFDEYLGHSVSAYVKLDERELSKIVYLETDTNRTKILEIDPYDFMGANSALTEVKYWDGNDRERLAQLSSSADYIYNGYACPEMTKSDIEGDNSHVLLIDNDFDGVYDVMRVFVYETYVVSAASQKIGRITFDYSDCAALETSGLSSIVLKDFESVQIEKAGDEIGADDLAAGDIVSLAISKTIGGKRHLLIVASDEKIFGKLTRVNASEKLYTIDKEEFRVAKSYLSRLNNDAAVGKEYMFGLDAFGRLVTVSNAAKDGAKYAWLRAFGYDSGAIDGELGMKLFTSAGEFEEKHIKDKIQFNTDGKKSAAEIYALLSIQGAQLIKYEENADGEVKHIWTAKQGSTDENEFRTESSAWTTGKYKQSMAAIDRKAFISNSKTSVLFVPENPSEERMYKVGTANLVDSEEYKYIAYNKDELDMAEIIVIKNEAATDYTTFDICVFEDSGVMNNSEGESVAYVQMYDRGSMLTLECDKDVSFAGLERGDLIQPQVSAEVVTEYKWIFDTSAGTFMIPESEWGLSELYPVQSSTPSRILLHGTVEAASTEFLKVRLSTDQAAICPLGDCVTGAYLWRNEKLALINLGSRNLATSGLTSADISKGMEVFVRMGGWIIEVFVIER